MKNNIHPNYHTNAKVTCVCGNEFETGSTLELIKTELCSMCHPFYTGTQKIVDSARRVEKFQNRTAQMAEDVRSKADKKASRKAKQSEKQKEATKHIFS